MNLSKHSTQQLHTLKQEVEKELAVRRKEDARKARQEMKAVAAKYGLSLNELVGGAASGRGRSKTAAAYRHPDDPGKTWSGRGRKPGWIKEWTEAGRSLDELKVA